MIAMKTEKNVLVKWLALVIIAALLALIPCNDVFTGTIKSYVIITVVCIGMIALSLFPSLLIPSILLMFAYRFIAPAATIMSGWAVDSAWIVICIFVIINALERSGLLRRLAFFCLAKTGGSYAGICVGLYIVGLVLIFLGDSAVMAVLPIGYSIVRALKLEHTKAGTGIMLAAFCGLIDAGLFIFNPSSVTWFYSMAASGSSLVGTAVSYGDWFKGGAVFILHWLAMLFVCIFAYRPKDGLSVNGREYFRSELARLGRMSASEKKLTVIIAALFFYLFTVNIHGQPMVLGFVAALAAMYLPGISVANADDVKNVNFGFPIFIIACLAIGNVSNELGVGQLIVDVLLPRIGTGNVLTFIMLVALLAFVLNFVMTPSAIYAALLAPLAAVTMSLHGVHDIFPLIAALWVGTVNVLLPHETTNNVVLYSFGAMTIREHAQAFAIRAALGFATLAIAYFYWRAIGLIG